MISGTLYTFLREWLDWAENDGDKHPVFGGGVGLCSLYDWWQSSDFNGVETYDELDELFEGEEFPFGKEAYYDRARENTQHLCPKRLAWVRQQIKQYEGNNNE